MWWLIGFLIAWLVLILFFRLFMWDDSDQETFEFFIFFSPLNILVALVLIFAAFWEFGLESIWKFFVKLWKKRRNRILVKKHKHDDPYGEEDWTE